MLAVVDEFAVKWGLNFNCTKSKLIVIGQRVDPRKKLALGNIFIE